MKWIVKDIVKGNASVTVAASSTAGAISEPLYIHDPRHIRCDVTVSAASETTGITLKLQDSSDKLTWYTKSSEAQAAVVTVAAVQTLTFPAKAASTGGDYFVVYDGAGLAWSVWLDKSGADVAPTGAIYAAIPAGRKARANISGDTSAIEVAATVELAFDGLSGATSALATSDVAADGTMTFTAVMAGATVTANVFKNADDSGVGSITGVESTPASFTSVYNLDLKIENSSDQADMPLRPFIRMVATTGAGDSITVSDCFVSHWGV